MLKKMGEEVAILALAPLNWIGDDV